jgi:hypothetical protein
MTGHAFQTLVESVNQGRGAAARLPFDPRAAFGRARAPVRVTVGEHEPFRTTVAVYGGVGWIGLRKAQLADMGLAVGDPVTMRVELDEEPREVEVPPELAAALAGDRDAAAAYEKLSYTHRREYARWIAEAKRSETRERRAAKAARMLRDGVRTPD